MYMYIYIARVNCLKNCKQPELQISIADLIKALYSINTNAVLPMIFWYLLFLKEKNSKLKTIRLNIACINSYIHEMSITTTHKFCENDKK